MESFDGSLNKHLVVKYKEDEGNCVDNTQMASDTITSWPGGDFVSIGWVKLALHDCFHLGHCRDFNFTPYQAKASLLSVIVIATGGLRIFASR